MSRIPKYVRVRIWGFVCAGILLLLIFRCWLNAFQAEEALRDEETELQEMTMTEMISQADAVHKPSRGELAKQDVRILIRTSHYENLLHKEVLVGSEQKWYLEYGSDQERREWHDAGETVLITEESPCFLSENGYVQIGTAEANGKFFLKNVERDQGVPFYRGILELRKLSDGIAVINSLELEEYLLGVVPSEMPARYPMEALKAQAVCARTYAVSHLLCPGYPELNAHLDDSTAYQAYGNLAEQENASKAIEETKGMVLLTKEGAFMDTFYYSTSCGRGTDVSVWDEAVRERINPFTEAVDDPVFLLEECREDLEFELPWHRWTYEVKELDVESLKSRLQMLMGTDEPVRINILHDLVVTKRAKGGAAKELTIISDEGTYWIRGERRIRELLCDGKTMAKRKDGSEVLCATLLPSAFFLLEIGKKEENVIGYKLTGGGYGHGVGMSQNGAMKMALRGSTAEEILKYYYEDGILSKME